MEYSIYTIGGFDMFVAIFNQLAAMLKSNGGSVFGPVVKMATAISVLSAILYAAWGTQVQHLGKWFISYFLILQGFLTPLASVIVKDTMTGQVRKIDNVPFGLAFIASNLSELGYGLTQATEQVFQPSPRYGSNNPRGMADADFAALSYTKTGFIFGAYAVAQMKSMQIADDDLADNLHEFVNQCVVYDAAIGTKYTIHDLKNSDNIWKLVSEKASKLRGFAWREVPRHDGIISGPSETKIITCKEGVEKINQVWENATQSALSKTAESLLDALGFKYKGPGTEHLDMTIASYLPGTLNQLTGHAASATDRIKQQLMITSIIKANQQKMVELGASPNFDVRRAYLQQRSTYKTIGETIAQTLPYLKNVVEALIYALFIFVLPLSLFPQGYRMLLFWTKAVIWVQLWAPLFAILNSIMTESMTSQIMNRVGESGGFTLANFVGIENAAADMASIAGYLCSMIPVLSWALIERGGYAFVNMTGSLLSMSSSAASAAAAEGFSGNYSYGNVSFRGVQAFNDNILKSDTSASYGAGHFAMNDGISSRLVSGDGENLINVQTSNLPVSVHRSSYEEQTMRNAYNDAMSTYNSETLAATKSKSTASSNFMEFSEQASHHVASNKQWSDQETAGAMQDAAKTYNKIKQIHDTYGIDEQLIAQTSLDVSGGIDVSKSVIGQAIGIRGGAVVRDDQTSLANINKAVAEITDLGQSKEFKSAISHAQNWSKNSNLDLGDQNLTQSVKNFGQHYESSLQSQKTAAAALDRSTAISNQIDFVRANAQRIDTVENQRFAEWAADRLGGYDKLEEVARKDMNRLHGMATHYLESNFGGNHHLPANEADLTGKYNTNREHIESSNVIKPDFSRVEKMSADNFVSQDRVIDDTAAKGWMQNIDQAKNDFSHIKNRSERAWAERNARMMGEELNHREENLGYTQKGKAAQMRQNYVKNN